MDVYANYFKELIAAAAGVDIKIKSELTVQIFVVVHKLQILAVNCR